MRIGLDSFTISCLNLNPFQILDYVNNHELEGVLFGGVRWLSNNLDIDKLKEVKAYADNLNLYTYVSVPTCNPYLINGSIDDHIENLKKEIEISAKCGWHELHSSLGGGNERYEHPVSWTQHLADSTELIKKLGSVLRDNSSRINLETHGDTTTFELVRLIESVGADIAGICLDTANVLCHAEDPVLAVRRSAPYTHLTHAKDAITFFTDKGYRRQTVPAGMGALDWEAILPILAEYSPDLPLSIEDHKWFFDYNVFMPDWLSFHPDLTCEEFARVIKITWECQKRIINGDLPDPDEYEKIPYIDQLEERLCMGRDYLKSVINRHNLVNVNKI
jgi:sugar phosphate isomerase/epimerase